MATVAIIGAGQLGSRHLQSLKMLEGSADVCVVEPRVEAAENARQRWSEAASADVTPSLRILSSIADLPDAVDVAIVATTSRVRFQVLRELLQRCSVKFLVLEKVLFQDPLHYTQFESMASDRNVKTYVNCPRRLFGFYQEMRELFRHSRPRRFEVTGGEWGLGCNAIHFLDLFVFLASANPDPASSANLPVTARINESALDPIVCEAKRPGYVEFFGSISGELNTGNGLPGGHFSGITNSPIKSKFRITSERGSREPHTIRIFDEGHNYLIHESCGEMITTASEDTVRQTRKIHIPFQSQLTQHVVRDLLSRGCCGLTPFQQSQNLHLELLHTLLHHYRSTHDKNASVCPIT